MSKKILNKVISAILVLAICSTAFLGCVASAETYTGSYTIIGEAYAEAGDTVKATVKINSTNAFVAGVFEIEAAEELDFYTARAISATLVEGGTKECPDVHTNSEKNRILFQGFNDNGTGLTEYTSVTFEITFNAGKLVEGTKYAVNVKAIDVTDKNEATYSITGAAGFVHVHKYNDGVADGDVTTYTCEVEGCGATKTETTKSDVKVDSIENENTLADKNVGGASITFAPNGDISLDFVTTIPEGQTVYLAHVDDQDNITKLISTEGKIKGYDAFQNDYVGGIKTIGDTVKAVFVVQDTEGKLVSKSADIELSIADYCVAVLDDDTAKASVKDYCKALLTYAKAASKYFEYPSAKLDAITDDNYVDNNASFNYTDDVTVNSGDNGWKLKSATISLKIKPIVTLGLEIDNIKNIAINVNMGDDYVFGAEDLTYDEGKDRYYLEIKDIPAKDVSSEITVTVGEDTDDVAKYSLKAYANRQKDKDADAAMLAHLLVVYSDALSAADFS